MRSTFSIFNHFLILEKYFFVKIHLDYNYLKISFSYFKIKNHIKIKTFIIIESLFFYRLYILGYLINFLQIQNNEILFRWGILRIIKRSIKKCRTRDQEKGKKVNNAVEVSRFAWRKCNDKITQLRKTQKTYLLKKSHSPTKINSLRGYSLHYNIQGASRENTFRCEIG